ncbi:MAG: cyclic nucleotide-binding domain-containing protein [Chthoniobacterales bacterium]
MPDLTQLSFWPFVLILGYPVLAIALLEFARHLAGRAPFAAGILRQVSYVLLPTGTIWLILRVLAQMPADNWGVRTAETAFALTSLYLLLHVAQAILMSLIADQTRAPKLLFDIVRIGVSMIWGSVIVSSIWNVNLGSLLAAMGVGSIALAFALQEFLGNLLSGMWMLSAHKFGIGDWIMVDGKAAKVVEMDWHTVTLVTGGQKVVVANSTLAKGNLTIAARARDKASVGVPLAFGVDIPPEQVRDAVMEAGRAVPDLAEPGGVTCVVTGIGDGTIKYDVGLSVANPGILSGPRDEFLSRFWYVAQRRGLRLDPTQHPRPAADAASRLHMLEEGGAFRRDPVALPHLAGASAFRRYRRGDLLLTAGASAPDAFFVVAGQLAVMVPTAKGDIRLELVAAGQFMVLQEMLAGAPSPVRVMADQDADVLAIPAQTLLDAMDRSRAVARDIRAVAEARRRAILPLNGGLRVVT